MVVPVWVDLAMVALILVAGVLIFAAISGVVLFWVDHMPRDEDYLYGGEDEED
jgi:hypothetical protein